MSLFRKRKPPSVALDPARQTPAVRKSICTGEMTGGYVDRESGKFHELMLLEGRAGLEAFCKEVGADPDHVETVY